ncbi:peroxiredoxin [Methylocystis echinoides]|jgi:peroxiredoxin|uniref:Glutathione-dependent peroxiredoxin n=1 Tax=Methylocystis echinoides TaxID=29468 RepID=A0A9W6LQI2_9HYPH|nr:peroxiredoxin [Methylocystis echinoides]GLI91493.1 peroxiredoxin [Methylocystis echinoides]
MTIKAGDRIPDVTVTIMGKNGPEPIKTGDYFKGRKIALFSVPGAFTPTCHAKHLPGFVSHFDELKAKGVDAVAVTAVNDVFTLDAWLKDRGAAGKIDGLADGSGVFVRALGLELDLVEFGLGVRGKRFSAIVTDGVVDWINVEENSSLATVSSAESTLEKL